MIKEKFEIAKKKLETKSYQESKILLKEIIAEEALLYGILQLQNKIKRKRNGFKVSLFSKRY